MVEVYVGLDVSDKSTHLCVVDGSGFVIWSGACATDPETIAKTLKTRAPWLKRAVLGDQGTQYLSHGCSYRGGVTPICETA